MGADGMLSTLLLQAEQTIADLEESLHLEKEARIAAERQAATEEGTRKALERNQADAQAALQKLAASEATCKALQERIGRMEAAPQDPPVYLAEIHRDGAGLMRGLLLKPQPKE